MTGTPHARARPRGRRARADDRPARPRRRRRGARSTATSCSCAAPCPATGSARESRKSKRSFAEADSVELLEPSPDRIEPVAPHPGAPWQVLPYERQLREKEDQVRDALDAHRPLRGPAGRADRAGARAARATATSSSTRSARTTRASSCSASTAPGRWDLIDDVERRHPRLRARRRAARRGQAVVPRRGAVGLGPARPAAACCATSWSARAGALAQLQARARHQPRVDLPGRTSSRPPRPGRQRSSGPAPTASPRPPATGETEVVKGRAYLEEELAGLRFRISPDAFFQTNTEMAERLYGDGGRARRA